jgi:Fur family ferric uptake transcriptional regulator
MAQENSLGSVSTALTPLERFEEYLQTKGMRITEQRRLLVDHVFNHHEHFDADTLIQQLPRKGEAGYVSRPTVYRTLNEFVDAGLLRKFELDGRAVFEHDYGYPKHDHLYCERSHKLIEFQSPELIELIQKIAHEHDFQVTSHRLIIQGVSRESRLSQGRRRRKQDMV